MSNYKESYFLDLQDYIAGGSKGELSEEQRQYEELLYATIGVVRKEGRQQAREWLEHDRGCTRHVAERVVWEAVNLFYQQDHIRQEAWRNVLFQKLMNVARLWEQTNIGIDDEGKVLCIARAKDYEAYVKIIKQAAALKRLSERDDQPGPQQTNTQINIYGTNAQAVGIPATDRRAILENPYLKQLPAKHRDRLAMEIGATPLDIDQVLDSSIELANEVAGE